MSQIEEIKNKLDIVDIISSYLVLKKAGHNFRGLCPFHREKTPSFMVSPDKQIWYCFGCSEGGDVFSFVKKIENLEFPQALRVLADKAGVILEGYSTERKELKDKYFEINDVTSRFYQYILNNSKEGGLAKDYLTNTRGIRQDVIDIFHIGYAPSGPDMAYGFLKKKGYHEKDLIDIGLITKDARGRILDKMRERIIFPILSPQGKVLGFGGRVFRDYTNKNFIPAKYLNSPQSAIYDKSSVLYGLYQARDHIRSEDMVVIVEGYLDVIASYQAGVKCVVASSGTALTHTQLVILARYTKNIILCFDSDAAGWEALKRVTQTVQGMDLDTRGIILKNAKDPDELVKKDPDLWLDAVKAAEPVAQLYYNKVITSFDISNLSEKKKYYEDLVAFIAMLGSEIEKAHYIKRMSYEFDIPEKTIMDAVKLRSKNRVPNGSLPDMADGEEKGHKEEFKASRELLLLGSMIVTDQAFHALGEYGTDDIFTEEKSINIYKNIKEWHNSGIQEGKSSIRRYLEDKMPDRDIQENISLICFLAESFFEGADEKQVQEDIKSLIGLINLDIKENKKKEIQKQIYLCDKEKDKEKIKSLLRELQDLI